MYESISSCLSSPFLEMHFTATFVPSLDVARMTLENAPVPSSLSSRLYFRANSEFASARSPPPPALEPCVVLRERSLGSAASALSTCVYAIEQTHHGDDVASMAWNLHAIEQAPSGLAARSLSLDRRSRARALLAAVRSVGRRARVAKRSAGARHQKQLETARGSTCCFYGRRRRAVDITRGGARHSPSLASQTATSRAVHHSCVPGLRSLPWLLFAEC